MLLAALIHRLCDFSFLAIHIGCRFRLSVLLAFVEHRAITLVLAPFASENFNKCLLFVEARILLEDCIILKLTETHILSTLLSSAQPGLRFVVVRDVAAYVALALKQI